MFRKILTLVFVGVLFVSCGDNGDQPQDSATTDQHQDPCIDVNCGGHGYCQVDDKSGQASCVCEEGYDADGMNCIEKCDQNCGDRVCGPDPICGRSCGDCGQGKRCNSKGQCECAPDCSNRVCGPDPVCGKSCGVCAILATCDMYGKCMPNTVGSCYGGWCLIPAGTFAMGSPDDEPGRDPNEGPVHNVTITRPFHMKQTVVTQGEWESLIGNNPSKNKSCGKHCPFDRANWYEAVWYANALSQSEGMETCYTISDCTGSVGVDLSDCRVTFRGLDCNGYRLPTEAEWEYAARAGCTDARYGDLGRIAWYVGNSWNKTHPVSEKTANAWGLYDVLGNVFEFAWDYYNEDYYSTCEEGCADPLGPTTGPKRVARGACFANDAKEIRLALRGAYPPNHSNRAQGFRLVRSAPSFRGSLLP